MSEFGIDLQNLMGELLKAGRSIDPGNQTAILDAIVEDLARSSGLTIAEFLDEITKDRKILSSADFITELNGAGGG